MPCCPKCFGEFVVSDMFFICPRCMRTYAFIQVPDVYHKMKKFLHDVGAAVRVDEGGEK